MTGSPASRRDSGVDHGWVMQMTFLLALVLGVPAVVLLSFTVSLDTWREMATFAVQVGSVLWLVLAVLLYLYERQYRA
ncbi:MAG: DUF5822 domain-containing protein [Halodesulfurarchaeum sp.]